MNDTLTSLWPRFCKPAPSDDIVESQFTLDEENITSITSFASCFGKKASKLFLTKTVVVLDFLLFDQTFAVCGRFVTSFLPNTGWFRPSLGCSNCSSTFEDHRSKTTIDTSFCPSVVTHLFYLPLNTLIMIECASSSPKAIGWKVLKSVESLARH